MDIVTLGAAQNYTNGHFKAGSNITFTENADGTVTMAASGEVSSEDTVARGAISDHVADKSNPHEVTASQVGLGNVNNTSDADKPISTATQAALDLKADATDIPTVNNATITIQKNGTKVDDFTVNASSNKTINITVPTSASDVSALPASTKYAGAATAGGSATSAAKLDTASAGSATQPVYFANGVPTSTTYSLGKSVPSDAVFTDTTVGSGIVLTGYTPESPEKADTIKANDTVNAAIKKLDERSRVDENNISSIYQTNVVNLVNIPDTTTQNTGYQADTSFNIPSGEYVVTYNLTTTGNFAVAVTIDGTERALADSNPPYNSTKIMHTFTAATGVTRFRAYFNGGGTIANIMICDKSAYDAVNGSYQPFAMSNADITAWILAHS